MHYHSGAAVLTITNSDATHPDPAAGFATDLNELLIRHPASTLFLRVSGNSMSGAGVQPGDLLVVDRGIEPRSGHIVVALLDGAFTLKRLVRRGGHWWLEAAHPAYPPRLLGPVDGPGSAGGENDGCLWGVATHTIRRL